mmetsp:Transcript_27779/g.76487  ORF Transcript_27779/g.76487 Transcript_27779/m.76487 type:complete len:209 (+) Transcript_27779:594-1220(+)
MPVPEGPVQMICFSRRLHGLRCPLRRGARLRELAQRVRQERLLIGLPGEAHGLDRLVRRHSRPAQGGIGGLVVVVRRTQLHVRLRHQEAKPSLLAAVLRLPRNWHCLPRHLQCRLRFGVPQMHLRHGLHRGRLALEVAKLLVERFGLLSRFASLAVRLPLGVNLRELQQPARLPGLVARLLAEAPLVQGHLQPLLQVRARRALEGLRF